MARRAEPLVDQGVVAGNVYDKYGTRNPIARRLMRGFLEAAAELAVIAAPVEVHEVGCGEGRLALFLARDGRRVRGSDVSPKVIEEARENARRAAVALELKVASLYDLEPAEDGAELVVCCEVLEHLEDPDRALAVLARLARPHLLVSVPREPIWRALNVARGRYLSALGNTPGHLQHWSRSAFLSFLASRVDVIAMRNPLPWTIALCRTRA